VNFSCGKCGRTYSVADERVRGRTFKVKCRGCDFLIVVKPTPVAHSQSDPLSSPPALARVETDSFENARAGEANQRAAAMRTAEEEIRQDTAGGAQAATPPPSPHSLPAPLGPPEEPDVEVYASGFPEAPGSSSAGIQSEPVEHPEAQDLPDLMSEPASVAPQAGTEGEPRVEASDFRPPVRKRLVLLALGGVGLVALGGLAYMLFARRAPVPVAALQPPAPPALVAPPEPPPEPTPAPPTPEPPPAAAVEPDLGKLMARPKTDLNRPETAQPSSPGDQDSTEETGNASVGKKNRIASLGPEGGVKLRRERLRVRRIATKDKKLLDLVGKTTDSAPVEPVERLQLDTAAQALDETQIAQTFADNHKAFDACFSRALRQNPSLRLDGRKIVASFVIRPEGAVSDPSIDDRQIDQSSLGSCLKAVCGRLVFPAFEGNPIQVDAPLVFNRIE
jgi:hypothetical protein